MTARDLLHLAAPLLVGQGWRFSEELATLLGFEPASRSGIGRAASGERPVSRRMLEQLRAALHDRREQISVALKEIDCALGEHVIDKSLTGNDLEDGSNASKPLDVRFSRHHNAAMVTIERVEDGKQMRVDVSRIRYGVGTEALTLASGLLRKKQRDGDATYYLPSSGSFGREVVILD